MRVPCGWKRVVTCMCEKIPLFCTVHFDLHLHLLPSFPRLFLSLSLSASLSLSLSLSFSLSLRACSHCVWSKRAIFFTWMRFGHVSKIFASAWKPATVRFRFSAGVAWTYEMITFSQFWLSGAFQLALLSYWAVEVDDLALQKASNQLLFDFAKKKAHFWTRVWLRLRLRESSPPPPPPPPVGDPRFRLSAFELAFTWKWDTVLELESSNFPCNDHENAFFFFFLRCGLRFVSRSGSAL